LAEFPYHNSAVMTVTMLHGHSDWVYRFSVWRICTAVGTN